MWSFFYFRTRPSLFTFVLLADVLFESDLQMLKYISKATHQAVDNISSATFKMKAFYNRALEEKGSQRRGVRASMRVEF